MITIKDLMNSFGYVPKETYYRQIAECDNLHELLMTEVKLTKELTDDNISLRDTLGDYNVKCHNDINKLKELLREANISSKLDVWLSDKYDTVNDIAYTGKRYYDDEPLTCYLKELITPNTWEVENFFNDCNTIEKAANKVAEHITWTRDSETTSYSDYYNTPNETIVSPKKDCEDHSYLTASYSDEIGVAYGYYYKYGKENKPNIKGGHAFNVMLKNNKLWIIETTGNKVHMEEYTGLNHYYIHFIVTKNASYMLDDSVVFGRLRK